MKIIKRAKEPKKYFKEFSEEFKGNKNEYMAVLNSHYINQECFDYLLVNDFKSFTRSREKVLVDEVKKLIGWTAKDVISDEEDLDINEIIDAGENDKVEFKSTFKKNLETGKSDDVLKFSVLKTITGFLNANGGTLIIGYDEKNHRKILGLQEDYSISKWQDKDGFEKEFWDYLEANVPKSIIDKHINLKFEEINGKDLAVVSVKRVFDSPIYIEKNGKKNFYVRRKNETELIEDPVEADKYKKDHF